VADDWDTTTSKVGIDLQYACTFPLSRPKDCTKLPQGATCDCGASYAGPLCAPNPDNGGSLTLQTRGKAYPTIRELRVAKAMGDHGVAASLCPRTNDPNDPDFGYRPFVRALADRLEEIASGRCLSLSYARQSDGTIPCVMLVTVPGNATDQPDACGPRGSPDSRGLEQPDPHVLEAYNAARLADLDHRTDFTASARDLPPACELVQQASCTAGSPGWCYVEKENECSIQFGVPAPGPVELLCGLH
jgi:hypothetical protein